MLLLLWTIVAACLAVCCRSNLRTLRTLQMSACEGERLRVECWPHTVVSVTLAEYGRPVPEDMACLLPPPNATRPAAQHCPGVDVRERLTLLCREQQECDVAASTLELMAGRDPCPGRQKLLRLAYKCRPNRFSTRVVCHKKRLRLSCHKNLRIVVYSATFGSEPDDCGAPMRPVERACGSSSAAETVMSACHGQRKCGLAADAATFAGGNCSDATPQALRVVYTCVPKDSLQDIEMQEETRVPSFLEEEEESDGVAGTEKADEVQSDSVRPTTSGDANCTDDPKKVVGFLSEWIAAYKFVTENREKLILYVTVSVGLGVLLFLLAVTARLHRQQRRAKKQRNAKQLSEEDPFVEVVRYTDIGTVPRAPLAAHSLNHYYYS